MNLETALTALLLFLPAGLANMTPIFASRLPLLRHWKQPLDFGASYRGKPVFGKNKTWRGLITGTLMAALLGYVLSQTLLQDYDSRQYTLMAGCMGFGALLGDAIESFFKRMRGIQSGQPWFPFDQTDYIIGGLLLSAPFGILSVGMMAWIFVLYFGLHLVSSYIGYLLGLKELPI